MHDIENMFAIIAAGFAFLVIAIGSSIGLWYALDYNQGLTTALVAFYGWYRFMRLQSQNQEQGFRVLWFLFWFDNEWYKLVLLLTGMFALTTWV